MELVKTDTQLVRVGVLMQDPNEVTELLKENLGNGGISEFDLPKIKVPSGGGVHFMMPNGEPPAATIKGVIVYARDVRNYYVSETTTGQAPDCHSLDSIVGIGKPGGRCADCPLAQFGSGKNGGQACKPAKQLFILRGDSMLPSVLMVPRTSLNAYKAVAIGATDKGASYWQVALEIGLEATKAKTGQPYSEITFRVLGKLPAELIQAVRQYRNFFEPMLKTQVRDAVPAAEPTPGEGEGAF